MIFDADEAERVLYDLTDAAVKAMTIDCVAVGGQQSPVLMTLLAEALDEVGLLIECIETMRRLQQC